MHGAARKQDFARLYSELGLRPGCTLSELKHAYRRRIAELHPDRRGTMPPRPGDAHLPLTDLIALYAAASDFGGHRSVPGDVGRVVGEVGEGGQIDDQVDGGSSPCPV